MTATPHPAATIVLLRDAPDGLQTFMVRRPDTASFLAGAQVFPGGRVDPADGDPAWSDAATWPSGPDALRPGRDPVARAALVAAVRELFEEAGVLLARPVHPCAPTDGAPADVASGDGLLGAREEAALSAARPQVHGGSTALLDVCRRARWRLALDWLLPMCRWVTPPIESRRFDTRFFLAQAPRDQAAAADGVEAVAGTWVRPTDALAAHQAGTVTLWPPTLRTIEDLAACASVEAARALTRDTPFRVIAPRVFVEAGRRFLLLPGDPLAPVRAARDALPPPTRFVEVSGRWVSEGASTAGAGLETVSDR